MNATFRTTKYNISLKYIQQSTIKFHMMGPNEYTMIRHPRKQKKCTLVKV